MFLYYTADLSECVMFCHHFSSINFSTGKFARLASGSALVEVWALCMCIHVLCIHYVLFVQSGSTSVLVTAVSEYKAASSASFLPLQVKYLFYVC